MDNSLTKQGFCTVGVHRNTKPLNIAYQLHGTSESKVLLITGHKGTLHTWWLQVPLLVQHGYEVCVFDNRNAGDSDKSDEPFTIQDMALDVVELLDHLEWKSNVHLVGLSMGGVIAQLLACYHPQYFKSVCITSSFMNINASMFLEHPPTFSSDKERIDTYIHRLFPEIYSTLQHTTNEEEIDWQFEAMKRFTITENEIQTIRANKLPILVCTGDEDNSKDIANTLCAPLKIFNGCGHVINIQEPDCYNEMLIEHFKTIDHPVKANI
ncbi:Alpha/Beta hydrolase protein [Syncephalis plumigaleata]|nr:Alpha/Beta hydrolase protein [Syncephalis plumigaleata]